MSESDSEDDYVVYGSPLAPLEENEVVNKKQKPLSYQFVKDKKGRPERFHGAFTGGFSAGYFNTVATPEGWTPSTFVSRRTNRTATDRKVPEDFMDEEDLGQFGIAPRKIVASDTFVVSGSNQRKRAAEFDRSSKNLVEPVHMTIGMKLLHSMGKINKHSGSFELDSLLVKEPSLLVLEKKEDLFRQLLKDKNSSCYFPKDNLHGLGYNGITVTGLEHGHINLFATPDTLKPGKTDTLSRALAISGYAFGHDDNDDIYSTDSLSNYDKAIGDTSTNDVKEFAGYHSKHSAEKKSNKLLDGFNFVSKPQLPVKTFAPPAVPHSFKPFHVSRRNPSEFTKSNLKDRSTLEKKVLFSENINVFSLLSKPNVTHGPLEKAESRSVLQASTADTESEKSDTIKQTTMFATEKSICESSVSNKITDMQAKTLVPTKLKPFASDPAKQERYELYIKAINNTERNVPAAVAESNMTEWEITSEREEFQRTANLYKPLSSVMSARFTPAKLDDNATERGSDALPLNDKQSAAKMKMYGTLTRRIREWYPDKIVCKRFNVVSAGSAAEHSGLKHRTETFSLFRVNTVKEELPRNEPAKFTEDDEEKSASVETESEIDFTPSNINTSSEKTELRTYDPTSAERPPIDLFRAVFENSSDESEEEESAKGNEVTSASYADAKETVFTKNVNNSDEIKLPIIDNGTPQNFFSFMVTGTENHIESEQPEAYGPVLPPPVNYNMENVSQDQSSRVHAVTSLTSEEKYTKHKKKSRSHKKQKHKAKQKKKSKKSRKHITKKNEKNGNNASSESGSESVSNEPISDTELLQKLKDAMSHRL